MTIDWQHFTPWSSLGGGLLIGLAASLQVLFNGRIAGISGIVGGLLKPQAGETGWRLSFLVGLLLAPTLYGVLAQLPAVQVAAQHWQIVTAGLLVGVGTRFGAGCTSGHGVCGISRLSPRSIVATGCFMASGIVTVYLTHHVLSGS